MSKNIEKSPLRSLFWRDEILQVMYWMQGEGLGEKFAPTAIQPLINTNMENLRHHMKKLCAEGYLEMEEQKNGGMFKLSSFGKKEAGRRFSEAFQGMQKAGHGECGPDCEYCYGPDGKKLENCVHNCGHQH